MGKNVHVVYRKDDKGWDVKYANESTPLSTFKTQEEAIKNGREIAMEQQSELSIHNREGEIREKNSYGNDPRKVHG